MMTSKTREFFSVGFRPFYLGAAVFAGLAVPLWLAALQGGIRFTAANPLVWHSHEMVFGFAPAVIAGFLLTAVRNWTGRSTPAGYGLAALFGLWITARVLNATTSGLIVVLVDASFFIALAFVLGLPLWRAGNWRNAFVIVLLLGLGTASAGHQAALLGWIPALPPTQATTLALDLILILMVVIGGRVIPAFSGNAIADLKPRSWPLLEYLGLASVLVILLLDALMVSGGWTPMLFLAAALLQVLRLLAWQPWKTWRNPLLLALPLAYAWIPAHLLLRAESPTSAMHALTIGAVAGLMLAMMTRSALGHTGRPLKAGMAECLCFAAIHCAALIRVCGPLWDPAHYQIWLIIAGSCWTIAFGTFAIAYWPVLTRPRIDA